MRVTHPQDPKLTTRLQLLLLLIAAMACVATLLASFGDGHRIGSFDFDLRHVWLILAVAVGGIAVIAVIWRISSVARREARSAKAESAQLRRNLAASDAIIRAEPQVLIFWEQGQAVRIVSHTLATVPGLPEQNAEILRFGQWLETESAHTLKDALDNLFVNGRSFSVILKTIAGGIIEAEGRAAGGRAVLRLKDISGYKLEIARIEDQHKALARDIRSSRALLNTLPMPVWLRGMDNRLIWVNAAYVKAVEAKSEIEVLERQLELLETRQRKSVTKAITAGQTYKSRIHLVAGGERKAHDVIVLPLDGMTAGAAVDVTDIESAQGELERQSSAYDRTLDRVETAVAIFSSEHKLAFYNAAFVKLWSLDTDWLSTHPSDSVILDRLREIGVLEPVVNHREWKAQILACYQTGQPLEDTWNLTDGRILHVMAEQRPDGGVTFLFADETERLALESP
jgi:PAS domain-containing protein